MLRGGAKGSLKPASLAMQAFKLESGDADRSCPVQVKHSLCSDSNDFCTDCSKPPDLRSAIRQDLPHAH